MYGVGLQVSGDTDLIDAPSTVPRGYRVEGGGGHGEIQQNGSTYPAVFTLLLIDSSVHVTDQNAVSPYLISYTVREFDEAPSACRRGSATTLVANHRRAYIAATKAWTCFTATSGRPLIVTALLGAKLAGRIPAADLAALVTSSKPAS